jgi:hypothetical protein
MELTSYVAEVFLDLNLWGPTKTEALYNVWYQFMAR